MSKRSILKSTIGALEALESLCEELRALLSQREGEVDDLKAEVEALRGLKAKVEEINAAKEKMTQEHNATIQIHEQRGSDMEARLAKTQAQIAEMENTIKMESMIKKQEFEIYSKKVAECKAKEQCIQNEFETFKADSSSRIAKLESEIATSKRMVEEKEHTLKEIVEKSEGVL